MKRNAIRGGMAVVAGMFLVRLFAHAATDLARYNRMRAMSGDPPLGFGRTPNGGRRPTNAAAHHSGPFALLASLPSDLIRYMRLESM